MKIINTVIKGVKSLKRIWSPDSCNCDSCLINRYKNLTKDHYTVLIYLLGVFSVYWYYQSYFLELYNSPFKKSKEYDLMRDEFLSSLDYEKSLIEDNLEDLDLDKLSRDQKMLINSLIKSINEFEY